MKMTLRFERVSFGFEQRLLFENISLSLAEGACAALIGPNGAGKTTLLRLAAGLLRPSGGAILVFGQDVTRLEPRRRAQSVALVPHQLSVPFDFSVRQIVEQGRMPYLGLFASLKTGDQAAVERAIQLADVTSLENRVFNELSGGEQQRVKIALGLAQEPRLLLLDEPAQNLDIGRQAELLDLLAEFRRKGTAVVAAMHHLQLIDGVFSSVILVTPEGTLLQGSPADILQPAILERAFNCPPRARPSLVSSNAASNEQFA